MYIHICLTIALFIQMSTDQPIDVFVSMSIHRCITLYVYPYMPSSKFVKKIRFWSIFRVKIVIANLATSVRSDMSVTSAGTSVCLPDAVAQNNAQVSNFRRQ
jgi:hypothetical protein